MRKIFFALLPLALFVIDRVLKSLAIKRFSWEWGNFFSFTYFANHRLAFSLPADLGAITAVSILLVLILLFWLNSELKKRNIVVALFLSYIIFGALSNLYDRLQYGWVVDYLHLKPFSYFNIADLMIGIGVILLLCRRRKIKRLKDWKILDTRGRNLLIF